ncbi:MAG TPA: permease prefix domain 1-containing protein, partial [Candidatus Acidoferrum sp.]|nr:permease prefix domain 1-containing protein [Candidatus Acidoferrum sp.]
MTLPTTIKAFLDEFERALRLSGRRRRRVLDEARDHLIEASQRGVAAGMDPLAAESAAVEAFGDAAKVASRFDPGLLTRVGQRAAGALERHAHSRLKAKSDGRWRRPPWSVPSGRIPSFRRRLRDTLPLSVLWLSVIGSFVLWSTVHQPVADFGAGFPAALYISVVILYISAAILAPAYGIAIIISARGPHLKPVWLFPGIAETPTAKVWYGLAFVIPGAIGWGLALAIRPTPSTAYLLALWLLTPVSFAGCLDLARAYSNRSVKRAIIAGLVPSF